LLFFFGLSIGAILIGGTVDVLAGGKLSLAVLSAFTAPAKARGISVVGGKAGAGSSFSTGSGALPPSSSAGTVSGGDSILVSSGFSLIVMGSAGSGIAGDLFSVPSVATPDRASFTNFCGSSPPVSLVLGVVAVGSSGIQENLPLYMGSEFIMAEIFA
jgi:hypothetical protein